MRLSLGPDVMLLAIGFIACTPALALAQDGEFVCLDSSRVTVNVLREPIPTDPDTLRSFLWNRFITGPEAELFECPVHAPQSRAESFALALVQMARADSLDAVGLGICLVKVLADAGRNVYLPIAASYGSFEGAPAWVILVKWEWLDSSEKEILGHARAYVMAAKDGRQLGFATCD
jgi:hypothetical protein